MQTLSVGEHLIFAIEQREEGPALHLMVLLPAQPPQRDTQQFVQVWRFDCLWGRPHEHLFLPNRETQILIGTTQPTQWCRQQLANLSQVFTRAGYKDLRVDQVLVNRQLDTLMRMLIAERPS